MSDRPRRRFLKQSAALVSGLAAGSCAPNSSAPTPSTDPRLDRDVLEALADHVLPGEELGEEGVARVLGNFEKWLSELEPVAERDHPYLWTDEIAYGPPDPAPLWRSQLEALELEAQKRHAVAFTDLPADAQRAILLRQLPTLSGEMPYAGEASHVAVGLAAYFYGTGEATDLAYGAAIEKQTCRGLDTGPDEPKPLGS